MAIWQKVKHLSSTAYAKTKIIYRHVMNKRPIFMRSAYARNCALIATSLFYKRDRLKPAICKNTEMVAEQRIPRLLRRPIFTSFAKVYRVNLKEVERPLREYQNFAAFFTRRIKRPLPPAQPHTVCSPSDGKVLVAEEVTGDKCHIIKGAKYSISELITGRDMNDDKFVQSLKTKAGNRLYQLVIYLAPGDYHRFHSPVDMQILQKVPIEGRCDSVSERTIAKGKPIYQKNGRVVVDGRYSQGNMTMVMVGALNVMRIIVTDEKQLKRGDQLGFFNLGSTIVMIIEARGMEEWAVKPGQKVKYGQTLFRYLPI